MPPAPSPDRALNAILPQISSAPYEAHQKARTFASRYVKATQYDVAIEVLFQSARELLKVGQTGSGVDLTGFLLDVYEAKPEGVTEESRGRLTQLIALTGSAGAWRHTIIGKCVAWSAKHGSYPAGDPALHHYIGELLYKEGAYDLAEPHYLSSGTRDSARSLAEMFIKWQGSTANASGIYALHGVLPYLLNGNVLAARTFITHFVSKLPHPSNSTSVTVGTTEIVLVEDPLVNFSQMAVVTCQRAQGDKNKVMRESWIRLCGTYQSGGGVLAAPEIRKLLQELSTLYFAIPPPRGQAGNPLADMMSSMFGGGGAGQTPPPRRMLKPAVPSITSSLD